METVKQMLQKLTSINIAKYKKLKYFFMVCGHSYCDNALLAYYNRQITKKNTQIAKMTRNLSTIPISMASINGTDGQFQYKLRDYYIASSYNSCCAGSIP